MKRKKSILEEKPTNKKILYQGRDKKKSNRNPQNSLKSSEQLQKSRVSKSSKKSPENRSELLLREFPNVTVFQESGLKLFRQSEHRSRIGIQLGSAKDWFNNQYRNDIEFQKYADGIEFEILNEIRENSFAVARGMFRIIEEIASGDYESSAKIEAGKLALAYLDRTGHLPKSEDKEIAESEVEHLIQGFANYLAEKFGPEMMI